MDAKQLADLQSLTADTPELQRELRVGISGTLALNVTVRSHDVVLLSLQRSK